jgi:hypothetical protein
MIAARWVCEAAAKTQLQHWYSTLAIRRRDRRAIDWKCNEEIVTSTVQFEVKFQTPSSILLNGQSPQSPQFLCTQSAAAALSDSRRLSRPSTKSCRVVNNTFPELPWASFLHPKFQSQSASEARPPCQSRPQSGLSLCGDGGSWIMMDVLRIMEGCPSLAALPSLDRAGFALRSRARSRSRVKTALSSSTLADGFGAVRNQGCSRPLLRILSIRCVGDVSLALQ